MRKSTRVFLFFFGAMLPLLMCFSDAISQSFTLGVKAGGSINWAAFGDKEQKDTFSTKIVTGYSAGFQLGFPLKNNFDLLMEAGYSREGRRITFNNGTWENKSIYHMAEGTLLLRKNFEFELQENVPSQYFFVIGPEVSYWFSTKGNLTLEGANFDYEVAYNKAPDGDLNTMYYNNINRWLFGLVLGVGFKAPLIGNQHIGGELRFVSGHTYLGTRSSSTIALLGYDDTMLTNLKSVNLIVTYTFDFDMKKSRMGKSTLKKKIKRKR